MANSSIEKKLWDAADQFRANGRLKPKGYDASRAGPDLPPIRRCPVLHHSPLAPKDPSRMHTSEIRIRNYRSIEDITIPLDKFTAFCGPNSCGKSNIFRAIQLAFQTNVSIADAQHSLPISKLVAGGPLLSVWIDCQLSDISPAVQAIVGTADTSIGYSFRLTRGGTVTRKLGAKALSQAEFDVFREAYIPVYVPPIRDLGGDGLQPFRQLMKAALQRAKGPGNIRQVSENAKRLLDRKARLLLQQQADLAKRILGADRLSLDTAEFDVEALYEGIGLRVHANGTDFPLSSLGTGHQSAVIMHLYRQLGEDMDGDVLYLFEEPDNHLHPSTIRSICDDLRSISKSSQVLVSTHSPVFLGHVGFSPLRPLALTAQGLTQCRQVSLLTHYSEKQARTHLESFGLKLTEPLLSQRVIVVEGATDKTVLSTLFEARQGRTVEQSDILIIVAGSKDRVVLLSHLLDCLSVERRALLDQDASMSAEVPHLKHPLPAADQTAGTAAVDTLTALLDLGQRRGRNAGNLLAVLRSELTAGAPKRTAYDNSPLEQLVKKSGLLTSVEQLQLKTAMRRGAKRTIWELLEKSKAFVWSSTLEGALLHNSKAEDCVETELVAAGEIAAPLMGDPNRSRALNNKLHGLANKPEILARLVLKLEEGGHFKRSEMNECLRRLFAQ